LKGIAMAGSPEEYRVQLEAYAGPLDLLLHLVKRHEIDLHDIPIAQLTDQYMAHLAAIETLDVERAGEFLVMAASLLEIKSKTIQPREQQAEDEQERETSAEGEGEDALDPRYELVQQLLAYKQYKDAANYLEAREAHWSHRFKAGAAAPKKDRTEGEGEDAGEADEPNAPRLDLELEDVNVLDLCEAFGRMLNSIGQAAGHQVTYDDTPIQLHAEDVADRLHREGPLTLHQLFEGRTNRSEMIGLFLATLELVRDKRVRVHQHEVAGRVTLELIPESERQAQAEQDDTPADWTDPETGEVQYDWPDEQGRQRAMERKKRREQQRLKQMRGETAESDQAAGDAEGEASDASDYDATSDADESVADDVFDPSSIANRSDDTSPSKDPHSDERPS
jgi:segregation and condensation protein A